MSRSRTLRFLVGAACLAVVLPWIFAVSHAQQAQAVAIDSDDIGGVVTGPNGPEAGVWVIAETRDLEVRYIKSVVTDDRGRYVVPDLPKAKYSVWARGYGLVDSAKVTSEPGKLVNITAKPAPDAAAAAHYYPAIYWYSMLNIPSADQFGGRGGIPAERDADRLAQHDQEQRLYRVSSARAGVHAYTSCGLRLHRAVGTCMAPARAGRASRSTDDGPAYSAGRARAEAVRRTGPIASPRASCRIRSPRDRKAWNAISSSRCATGWTRSTISTI